MDDSPIALVGYCEPLSCRPGDTVDLKLSSEAEAASEVSIDIVELICGDPGNPALGLVEKTVDLDEWPCRTAVGHQPIHPGSFATFGPSPLLRPHAGSAALGAMVYPTTRPLRPQPVLRYGDLELRWTSRGFTLAAVGDSDESLVSGGRDGHRSAHGRWYEVRCTITEGRATLESRALATRSPGTDSRPIEGTVELDGVTGGDELVVARGTNDAGFDGRVAGLWLDAGAERTFRWHGGLRTHTAEWVDTGPHALHGALRQLPTRAVRGPHWDGSAQDPAARPDHYDAVHFHTDDVYDAGWETTATLRLPHDLPSGIYAFRSRGPAGVDRTPFFVAPRADHDRKADVAFLAPVATYLAYANQRVHLTNPELTPGGGPPPASHHWLRDHPEVGYSQYEYHDDRSGVAFSSARRPIINLKPGADQWGFTPDTNILAFLRRQGGDVDVLTDAQLHAEGAELLAPYRVIVTGSHPEYWSTAMLDGLEAWQRNGGRLMYLGGNGFYWRVAFSDHWPGAMEVRRAEDGTRAWIAEAGEYHHAFGGEYGGLWRRLGRPPNLLCGIGFAAQGFGRGAAYQRTHDEDERAGWIFDGVEGDTIGAHGVGGGAAGQEIDRFDIRLGSPDHAVVVATATDHDESMLRTKEEWHYTVAHPRATSLVRADMVFYESAGGGAVFSVGSIAWYAALATDGYRNDVARVTANVLRRFRDPAPFEPPP